MRIDPDKLAAARARILAMTTGAIAPDAPLPRRTATRRSKITDTAFAILAEMPTDTLRLATDPVLLNRVLSLAAAIELASDIAAIIDRPGRDALDQAIGADIRQLAVENRGLGAPRSWRTTPELIATHAEERDLARAIWAGAFPPGLRFIDGGTPPALPLLAAERLMRMNTALQHAQALILHPADRKIEVAA